MRWDPSAVNPRPTPLPLEESPDSSDHFEEESIMTKCSWLVKQSVGITLTVAVIAMLVGVPTTHAAERAVLVEYFGHAG